MSDNPYIKGFLEVEEARKKGSGNIFAEAKKLDPVGKEDNDVDNDGDSDSSDEYLRRRRAAISKAVNEENISDILESLTTEELIDFFAEIVIESAVVDNGILNEQEGRRFGLGLLGRIVGDLGGLTPAQIAARQTPAAPGATTRAGGRGAAGLARRRSAVERAAERLGIPASEVAPTLGMGSVPSAATRAMTDALDRARPRTVERPGPTRAAAARLPSVDTGGPAAPRAPDAESDSGFRATADDALPANRAAPAAPAAPELPDAIPTRPSYVPRDGGRGQPGSPIRYTPPAAASTGGPARYQPPAAASTGGPARYQPPAAASTGGPARYTPPAPRYEPDAASPAPSSARPAALAAMGAAATATRDSGPTTGAAPETPTPQRDSWQLTRTLRRGDRGEDVRSLQRALGFSENEIDGIFGGQTAEAVRRLQQAQGIQADAIVGRQTYDTIRNLRSAGSDTADSPYSPREVRSPGALTSGFRRGGR